MQLYQQKCFGDRDRAFRYCIVRYVGIIVLLVVSLWSSLRDWSTGTVCQGIRKNFICCVAPFAVTEQNLRSTSDSAAMHVCWFVCISFAGGNC